jgi:hypothetical protein
VAGLADIRPKLAGAITAAITDAQCTGYVLASPTSPFFDIELAADGMEYDQSAGNGIQKISLTIRGCIVGFDLAQQKKLDEWTAPDGTRSLKQILEADGVLEEIPGQIHVGKASGYRLTQIAGSNTAYLGAEWAVEVFTQQ